MGNNDYRILKIKEEKRVKCLTCQKSFRNYQAYMAHKKFHDKDYVDKLKKRMTKDNPMNYAKYRKKISDTHKKSFLEGNYKVWNKGIKWVKDKWHNELVEKNRK